MTVGGRPDRDPAAARDPALRRAALTAAAVAVPIALLAGLIAYGALGHTGSARAGTSGPAGSPAATGPVPVAARSLAASGATMCLAFVAALPTDLGGLPERLVSAGAEQNAAFGDPPIVARCGVAPASYAPTDQVYVLSGVCWHETGTTGATEWTTLDRLMPVSVTVPASYTQPGQWVARFSGPLISSVPSVTTAPPGCTG